MYVVVGYPDVATQERAMKGMAEDPDWKRVASEIEKLAPLEELYVHGSHRRTIDWSDLPRQADGKYIAAAPCEWLYGR